MNGRSTELGAALTSAINWNTVSSIPENSSPACTVNYFEATGNGCRRRIQI